MTYDPLPTTDSSTKEPEAPKKWRCYAKAKMPEACSNCLRDTSLEIFAAIPAITGAEPYALLTYPRTYSKDMALTLATNASTYLATICSSAPFTQFLVEELPS